MLGSIRRLSDVWYLQHFVECLGRIKKREAGVEAMFQEFVSFMSGSLVFCLMRYSLSFGVLCIHSRDVLFVTM